MYFWETDQFVPIELTDLNPKNIWVQSLAPVIPGVPISLPVTTSSTVHRVRLFITEDGAGAGQPVYHVNHTMFTETEPGQGVKVMQPTLLGIHAKWIVIYIM